MRVDIDQNRELILTNERAIARQVAGKVIDKPQLALWMILIPVFFVFYFFHLKRYRNGLQDFSENFLITRQRTLDAVWEATTSNANADLESVVELSDIPAGVKDQYRVWVERLADNYLLLIQASGGTYDELVRAAYKKKSNYLLGLKNLNRVEANFNQALAPHLPGDQESIESVIKSMQSSIKDLRRSQAEEIFS
ncbi:MAG: NF038143 family protein [Desulfofustis sp.]|nr:NF038143 family protein [Desulfofustis sp.]